MTRTEEQNLHIPLKDSLMWTEEKNQRQFLRSNQPWPQLPGRAVLGQTWNQITCNIRTICGTVSPETGKKVGQEASDDRKNEDRCYWEIIESWTLLAPYWNSLQPINFQLLEILEHWNTKPPLRGVFHVLLLARTKCSVIRVMEYP